jgi:hypothetical protein
MQVLADLRPNTKARAELEQFQLAQGLAPDQQRRPAREVSVAWRQSIALVPATVRRSGR